MKGNHIDKEIRIKLENGARISINFRFFQNFGLQ